MFGDAGQNVPQVTFGIDSVQLCRSDQAVKYRSTLAAPVRPSANVRKVGHNGPRKTGDIVINRKANDVEEFIAVNPTS
jgi:hypothetical protein